MLRRFPHPLNHTGINTCSDIHTILNLIYSQMSQINESIHSFHHSYYPSIHSFCSLFIYSFFTFIHYSFIHQLSHSSTLFSSSYVHRFSNEVFLAKQVARTAINHTHNCSYYTSNLASTQTPTSLGQHHNSSGCILKIYYHHSNKSSTTWNTK